MILNDIELRTIELEPVYLIKAESAEIDADPLKTENGNLILDENGNTLWDDLS